MCVVFTLMEISKPHAYVIRALKAESILQIVFPENECEALARARKAGSWQTSQTRPAQLPTDELIDSGHLESWVRKDLGLGQALWGHRESLSWPEEGGRSAPLFTGSSLVPPWWIKLTRNRWHSPPPCPPPTPCHGASS